MQRTPLHYLTVFLAVACWQMALPAQEAVNLKKPVSKAVTKVATDALDELHLTPEIFGLAKTDGAATATLGTPIREYIADAKSLDLANAFSESSAVLYPVMVGEDPKTVLRIADVDDKPALVGSGGHGVLTEQVVNAIGKKNLAVAGLNYAVLILRMPESSTKPERPASKKIVFVAWEDQNQLFMVPMQNNTSLGLSQGIPEPAGEVLARIMAKAKAR